MLNILQNWFYFYAGIAFLGLAKAKYLIEGYASPKPFSIREVDRCIEYDIRVVNNWLNRYIEYSLADRTEPVTGKRILELGPGSDLGVGLYLLSEGAEEYNAIDVNALCHEVPNEFYDRLLEYLKQKNTYLNETFLKNELDKTRSGKNNKLNYVHSKDFDIAYELGSRKVDIIFSQAAFEHFDNPDKTIKDMTSITVKGGVAIVLVDLKTHSRWIRDKDPNNIYRYPKWLYDLFYFRGVPNRVRPCQYKESFEKHGWGNVVVTPQKRLSSDFSKERYAKDFRREDFEMHYLSVWVYATRL